MSERTTKEHVYGKDCPVGMVQVAFVGCSPENRQGDYGWTPQKSAFLEVYVDGKRFRIDVGDVEGGRGLHVCMDRRCEVKRTAANACSILLPEND